MAQNEGSHHQRVVQLRKMIDLLVHASQCARIAGASRIIGVDLNANRFELDKESTDCVLFRSERSQKEIHLKTRWFEDKRTFEDKRNTL
ncbi:hypothetical protein Tco_1428737 [Tanacetum coccineum]